MAFDVQLYSFGLDYGPPSWRPIRPLTLWKLVPETPVPQVRSFSDFFFFGPSFFSFFFQFCDIATLAIILSTRRRRRFSQIWLYTRCEIQKILRILLHFGYPAGMYWRNLVIKRKIQNQNPARIWSMFFTEICPLYVSKLISIFLFPHNVTTWPHFFQNKTLCPFSRFFFFSLTKLQKFVGEIF